MPPGIAGVLSPSRWNFHRDDIIVRTERMILSSGKYDIIAQKYEYQMYVKINKDDLKLF